jgi:glycosyltransferase involved in cell wall biosynthesis
MLDEIPEGHHIVSSRIIEAAFRAGVDTKVVSIESSGTAELKHRPNFHRVTESGPFALFNKVSTVKSLPQFYADEFFSCSKVVIYARQLECNIIHYLNVTKEVASLAQKLLGNRIPCVAHLYHSAGAFNHLDFRLRLFSVRMRLFDFVFATNKSLVQYLTERLGITSSRIFYVPSPIDTNKFKVLDSEKLRQKYDLSADIPLIVYVGAIYPDRGIFVLLEAFKKLLERMPEAMLYVFHPQLQGDEVLHFPHFNRIVNGKEFSGRVMIQGPNSNIEEAYCIADVVALPFTQPYWITDPPLVLLEAMACGASIVTTPVGAIADIVSNGDSAVFCKPCDESSLANALFWALMNKDKAEQLGVNARRIIEREFAMDLVGKQLRSIYEKILD